VFNLVPQLQKSFPRYWCSWNLPENWNFSYHTLVYRPNLFKITPKQWKVVIPYGLCLGAMNLIFYLAIERIPIGLAVTLEFIGPLLVAVFWLKTFCRLFMGTSCSSRCFDRSVDK
jgi:drug/metabolite transporter (DMT)-like permease